MSPPRQRGGRGAGSGSEWDDGRGGWGPDGWRGGGFPTPSKPLPVEGGLTARSTRGGIGEQWWSRRFIEVMESFGVGGRLTRGRSYARKGQVISLRVEPGEVTASVQGSRVTPYKVRIGLPPFTELVWAKAEVVLAEQAIHSARLLAGEFPPELEPVFAGIGAPLFPVRLGDLNLECSCPDYVVPCKHLAAVFYLLAERFDDDPFLILRWRGRAREVLLRRLRELRGAEPAEASTDNEPDDDAPIAPVLSAALALEGLEGADGASGRRTGSEGKNSAQSTGARSRPAGKKAAQSRGADPVPKLRLDGEDTATAALSFWTAGEALPLPSQPELPVDLLLRLLPVPGPALGGTKLLDLLGPMYFQLTETPPETYRGPRHGNLGS